MKDFTRPRGRLRSLPLAARVVYSVFLGFTLIALGLTAWLTQDMVGLALDRVEPYYAGSAPAPSPAVQLDQPAADGPVIDLPPDADAASEPPMSIRKLLEVTHFHLFSMPVYLLILSHLFMLARISEAAKVAWIVAGTSAVAGHMAAPWLVRSGAAGAATAYGVTGALLAISMLVMSAVPLIEMWLPAPSPPTADEATD
jgi:hypothetical protein